MTERAAPPGAIWVCAVCGKTHSDLYGIERAGSRSWDESCALNAVLCHKDMHVRDDGTIGWIAFSEPIPFARRSEASLNRHA